jgi:FtsH-binding integral membrane protein
MTAMRDSKCLVGVLAFLAAMPAWASDMCEMGALMFLPPVFLGALIAFLIGLLVSRPSTARVCLGLLFVGAFPMAGLLFLCINGAFHGTELRHEGMFHWSLGALATLVAAYVSAYGRLRPRLRG